MKRMRLIALILTFTLAAAGLQTNVRPRKVAPAPAKLADLLPPGALLTIESPNFAALLKAWSASAEAKTWLASANYSVFQNSRLFSRLADAQSQFASTAKLSDAGTSLLSQVAGRQSIFAWYDVGKLEFLYVTRISTAQATQSELLQARAHFQRRQVGPYGFYVRTQAPADDGPSRTVAFATVNDLLLLSTREDLMANALQLIASPGPDSLKAEPWYSEANAAAASSTGPELHMVLNLERLVPMPYFRSYWIQQNMTELQPYRSAVADLYREPTGFREERALLLKSPASDQNPEPDLAPLAALVPPGTGVYKAFATTSAGQAVASIQEKLLGHSSMAAVTLKDAPDPTLAETPAGDVSDLESRIDVLPVPQQAASTNGLASLLQSAGITSVLTLDSTSANDSPWISMGSAVVLQTSSSVQIASLETTLQQALRGSLTTGKLGIEWRPASSTIQTLAGPKPLYLAVQGRLCLLTNNQPLLETLLSRMTGAAQAVPIRASLLGAFDHGTERAGFSQLTNALAPGQQAADNAAQPGAPAFFSSNLQSLSNVFQTLQSEQILTQRQVDTVHQTVRYNWQQSSRSSARPPSRPLP